MLKQLEKLYSIEVTIESINGIPKLNVEQKIHRVLEVNERPYQHYLTFDRRMAVEQLNVSIPIYDEEYNPTMAIGFEVWYDDENRFEELKQLTLNELKKAIAKYKKDLELFDAEVDKHI